MATKPELNKGVILYAALNLEESSETIVGIAKAMARLLEANSAGLPAGFSTIRAGLFEIAEAMHVRSVAIRKQLETVPNDFRADLTREEVKEIADGTTDLMVTNSGFANSLGINGAACYEEVQGSNLSKRNPDTGMIDKKPDGKWIKGHDYREPDLFRVIFGE